MSTLALPAPMSPTTVGNLGLVKFGCALFFAGVQLNLNIYSGSSIVVPGYLILLASMLLLYACRSAIKRSHLRWMALLLAVAWALSIGTTLGAGLVAESILALIQFSTAIVCGYALFLGLMRLGLEGTHRFFGIMLAILVVGSFLELYAGLRIVSDAVRDVLYPGQFIYSADARDMQLFGGARPKFFASEPSYLGITTGTALIGWTLTSRVAGTFGQVTKFLLIAAASYLVIRSGTLLFSTLICLLVLPIMPVVHSGRNARRSMADWLLWLLAAVMGATVLIVLALVPSTLDPILAYLDDGSFYLRILGPIQATFDQFNRTPLFGVGIGADELLTQPVWQLYASNGVFTRFPFFAQSEALGLITNAFWWHWLYFGLLGGLAVYALVYALLRGLGVPFIPLVLLATFIFWNNFGGYTTARAWFFLFLIAAVFRLQFLRRQGDVA